MNAEDLELFDRCHRLYKWSHTYQPLRISPLRALYSSLYAGLTGDGEPTAESHLIELAATPGLDIEAVDLYGLAIHYSKLAAILTAYLRGNDPAWIPTPSFDKWNSLTYQSGDNLRRIVLIDHWSDQRKMAEIRSWRTIAETSLYNKPMLINFISIGSSRENRRISPWTRTLKHPKNHGMRFAKRGSKSDGFTDSWIPMWREQFEGSTLDWLTVMQQDDVFSELVHSIRVPVSPKRDEILADIERIEQEMTQLPSNPPMTRSSCYGISPCGFLDVCHAPNATNPGEMGWISLAQVGKAL